jgi:hypothetical protein
MIRTAYKIVVLEKDGTMLSPISFSGLAVQYKVGEWAKAHVPGHYLFVYQTLRDAKKVFGMIRRAQIQSVQRLVIVECSTKNLRKAVGAGPVPEYRCTELKPERIVNG